MKNKAESDEVVRCCQQTQMTFGLIKTQSCRNNVRSKVDQVSLRFQRKQVGMNAHFIEINNQRNKWTSYQTDEK